MDRVLIVNQKMRNERKQDHVFTVSSFIAILNEIVGRKRAYVVGEVAEFKTNASWVSFSLTDEEDEAVLRCYLGVWNYRKGGVEIESGMSVKLGGFPRVTKRTGSLSFVVESIEAVGEGSLRQAYELLKRRLRKEGMFEQKRPLPECVESVGIVTSRSGVVYRDFLENLKKIGIAVYLYDTRVEGKDAIAGISNAIEWFNNAKSSVDVIILMRGGGSLESMQAFDNEVTARAVYASKIPTIAAIGHHVDISIVAHVADLAVSTPTAAAVAINITWELTFKTLENYKKQLPELAENHMQSFLGRIERYKEGLIRSVESVIQELRVQVNEGEKYLSAVNPGRLLALGYCIVFAGENIVKRAEDVTIRDIVVTKTGAGEFSSIVQRVRKQS